MANIKKNVEEKLTKKIVVRCTNEEYERWKEMAESSNLTMSKIMRAAMRRGQVQSKSDSKAIAELRRLGGLLKKILVENPDVGDLLKSDIRITLNTMVRTMNDVMLKD